MTRREPVLDQLTSSYGRLGAACYGAVLCVVTVTAVGAVGLATHQPWLFPSVGPTVLLFFESPEQKASRPGNTLAGHGVGLLTGIACFYAFGVDHLDPAPTGGLQVPHVLAGVVSIAVTSLILALVKRPHPVGSSARRVPGSRSTAGALGLRRFFGFRSPLGNGAF